MRVTQSCQSLCDPMDYCLSGSSAHGILQVRRQKWVAIPISTGFDPGTEPISPALQADSLPSEMPGKVKVKSLSHVRLFAIPWTVAYQVPPPMGFSRQEYWSGLPFPSAGDLPDPGIELLHCRLTLYCLSQQGSQKMPGKPSIYMLRSISIGNITP